MTTEERPEYVACAFISAVGKERETWCGRPTDAFVFQDATHAALNGAQEGRLVLCRDCRNAIVMGLSNGIEEEGLPSPFVQIAPEPEGALVALDEDGNVWRYSQKIGTPDVYGWYPVSMDRFE